MKFVVHQNGREYTYSNVSDFEVTNGFIHLRLAHSVVSFNLNEVSKYEIEE